MDNWNDIESRFIEEREKEMLRENNNYHLDSKFLNPFHWKRDLHTISNTLVNIAYSLSTEPNQKYFKVHLDTLIQLYRSIKSEYNLIPNYNIYDRYQVFLFKIEQFIPVCNEFIKTNNQEKLLEFFERLLDSFEELPN
ncbi:hypothetical protein LDK94_06740 [Staphylococcus arlettae]|uniref:hypothetical protein n=1 Tax=Staphylococcus arlettae TaxID=29378 RepID=UPI001E42A966|nr:hypothetical protein [Staphylococcus arlettae]MCD9055031.1 hypothetical protein [Staphylococcus arlettae]